MAFNWKRERFISGRDAPDREIDFRRLYLGTWDAAPAKVSDERLKELQYPKEAKATGDEVVSMAYELWNRRDKERNGQI